MKLKQKKWALAKKNDPEIFLYKALRGTGLKVDYMIFSEDAEKNKNILVPLNLQGSAFLKINHDGVYLHDEEYVEGRLLEPDENYVKQLICGAARQMNLDLNLKGTLERKANWLHDTISGQEIDYNELERYIKTEEDEELKSLIEGREKDEVIRIVEQKILQIQEQENSIGLNFDFTKTMMEGSGGKVNSIDGITKAIFDTREKIETANSLIEAGQQIPEEEDKTRIFEYAKTILTSRVKSWKERFYEIRDKAFDTLNNHKTIAASALAISLLVGSAYAYTKTHPPIDQTSDTGDNLGNGNEEDKDEEPDPGEPGKTNLNKGDLKPLGKATRETAEKDISELDKGAVALVAEFRGNEEIEVNDVVLQKTEETIQKENSDGSIEYVNPTSGETVAVFKDDTITIINNGEEGKSYEGASSDAKIFVPGWAETQDAEAKDNNANLAQGENNNTDKNQDVDGNPEKVENAETKDNNAGLVQDENANSDKIQSADSNPEKVQDGDSNPEKASNTEVKDNDAGIVQDANNNSDKVQETETKENNFSLVQEAAEKEKEKTDDLYKKYSDERYNQILEAIDKEASNVEWVFK